VKNILSGLIVAVVMCGGYLIYENIVNSFDESLWVTKYVNLGKVSVEFPNSPKVQKASVEDTKLEILKSKDNGNEYIVTSLKGNVIDISEFYPHSFVAKGATIVSQKDITIDGKIGKEFQLMLGNRNIVQRMLKFDETLIGQIAIYTKTDLSDNKVKYFLDTIKMD
jgi:hypothetical protein